LSPPIFFDPDEPDELVDIHVRMSMSQFTAIASSIDIGRDIGYGERSYELWRTWCKSLIGLCEAMSCEEIADCVESELVTNIELQNSIAITVNESGFGNPNQVNPTLTTPLDRNPANVLQEEPVGELVDCNLDTLWGGLRYGIVARMDDKCRDMLEDLAIIADTAARLVVFIDIVPVIGDLVEALAFQVTAVLPTLTAMYNAYSSEETLDELACELFAIVCDECRYPTFQEVYDVYNAHTLTGMALNGLTINEVAEWVLDAATGADELAYFTLQIMQLGVFALGATFNGESGTNAINKFVDLGEDFATDNWRILCDTCNDPYSEIAYDFTQSQHGSWVNMLQGTCTDPTTRGIYVAGKGWLFSRWATGSAMRVAIMLPLDLTTGRTVRALGIKWSGDAPDAANNTLLYPNPQSSTGTTGVTLGAGTGEYSQCMAFGAGTGGVKGLGIAKTSTLNNTTYLEKVVVLYDSDDCPSGAVPTSDTDYCD